MLMKSEIETLLELFLVLFTRLQKETNNVVARINWLSKEKPSLCGLCYDLNRCFREISRFLIKKKERHIVAPPSFFKKWEDFKQNWESTVVEAAKIEEARIIESLDQYKVDEKTIEEVLHDLVEITGGFDDDFFDDEFEERLDPPKDNPATIMNELHSYLEHFIDNDYFEGVINNKHLEAWDFFMHTIGIDYSKYYERWQNGTELFISSNMLSSPIEELYNEAVRTYVFGLTEASVAMCRALMEHILKKYYRGEGDNLADIISSAERQFKYLKGLKLHSKRKLVNKVLHDYENRSQEIEKAAFNFLQTIRHLVARREGI